jgi:hypothetical protein
VYAAPPRFGVWDALFLWFLLDTLNRPGHADWFYNHQDDPGVQQWRREAERLGQENAEIRGKLDTLDRQLAEREGQPRDPSFLPPNTPAEVARAPGEGGAPPSSGGGWPGMILVILLGGGVLGLLWLARRRAAGRARGGGGGLGALGTAGAMLRQKLSGAAYTPSHFRVGMTVPLDPTPFLLAGGATKVPAPPETSGAGAVTSVQAVGTLRDGTTLHRLYLDDRRFLQLHLDAAGNPDECRYFALIDEVAPASEEEWAFWLDEREGMIGWPEFQTKDGKVYQRAWAPGPSRIAPRRFAETIATSDGTRDVTLQAMLYAGPTGAAPPAPATEYILVAMAEADGQAWVEIRAGIDVNPASLNLS